MHIAMSGIHTPKFGGYRQWLEIQLPYGLDQDGSSYIVELVLVLIMYEIFNAPNLVQSINQSIDIKRVHNYIPIQLPYDSTNETHR